MAKYIISPEVINVHISQKIWTKKDKAVFDTDGKFKNCKEEVELAYERGFLVMLEENDNDFEDLKAIEEIKEVEFKDEKKAIQQPKKREYPKKGRK